MIKRTAIYGGSFDPIHKGHTSIIKKLQQHFDHVLVVPAYISPFKHGQTEANHRLNMLRIALKEENLDAQISEFEMEKSGISYTIDTLKHYHNKSGQLYFVLGSEGLKTLSQWRDYNKLKRLAIFYVIERLQPIQNLPDCNLEFAPFTVPEISSSIIKLDIAFERENLQTELSGKLSAGVREYIDSFSLYNDYAVFVRALTDNGLSIKRIEHTYRTTEYAIRLCKLHGINIDSAVKAAILHDVGKNASSDKYNEIPLECRHGFIGADIAHDYYGIANEDILNAIRYHTTLRPNMSPLEQVISLADKLEYGRDYKGIETLRSIAERNLEEGTLELLKHLFEYFDYVGIEPYELTKNALRYYKQKGEKQ